MMIPHGSPALLTHVKHFCTYTPSYPEVMKGLVHRPKWPQHEADKQFLSNAEVKNVWSLTSTNLYVRMVWGLYAPRIPIWMVVTNYDSGVVFTFSHISSVCCHQ
jgi:hypothetical protein